MVRKPVTVTVAVTVTRVSRALALPGATAVAAAAAIPAGPLLALLARRSVLRPLDELLGHDEPAVLVLRDELETDAAPVLVDLLHEHVEDVATRDHVLD